MLISDSHCFIFVHIRKAAGTSIRTVIQPLALPPRRSRWQRIASRLRLTRDYRHRSFRPHAPLRHAEEALPPTLYEAYFKFGFVRNPWERLISEYEYIRNLPAHPRHRRVVGMAFADFVSFQAARPDAHQYQMLRDRAGKLGADFVGHVETLQADFDRVCDRLGLPRVNLARSNTSGRAALASYYDNGTVKAVADAWRQDIEWFGYPLAQPDLAGLESGMEHWQQGEFRPHAP